MNKSTDREKLKIYLRLGTVFLMLNLFSDLINNPETFAQRVVNNVWLVVYLGVLNFLLFEYTLPFIKLKWTRLLAAPFLLFAHLMLYSFGFYFWRFIGIQLNIYFALRTYPSVMEGVSNHVSYAFFSVFFFGIFRHLHYYKKLKATAQSLLIEKQAAELNYLKSQTNPHFLFNTLNNIYALARDKSDLAPESILRLSQILRFMLYETGGAYIAIEQELKIITDYIALEKLRYDESLSVNFEHNVEDMKQQLPPLLLIPLVENAFKHGVSETRGQPFVAVNVSVKDQQLTFFVKNSTDSFSEDRDVKENIGLSNLRRQLELLYTDYLLTVQQGDGHFTAILKINLASHV